jgi:pimeloyl-ACP methyl ester carboxylesterase
VNTLRERIEVGGHWLEVERRGPSGQRAIVMLHEGLGSVPTWRDWPATLASQTGCPVVSYSRLGYGASDPCELPRPLSYMHEEAGESLPRLLDALGLQQVLLVGHSDGASIAIILAGSGDARIAALALLAPHVFVEDCTIAAIEQAKLAFEHGDLRARLQRHHARPEIAFKGWNDAWLDPGFRSWNIEGCLPSIAVPVVVVQGEADPYGTRAQVERIARAVAGPFQAVMLNECGHAPQRDRPLETTAAIAALTQRVWPNAGSALSR